MASMSRRLGVLYRRHPYMNVSICSPHSGRWQSSAAPRSVQCTGGSGVGRRMSMMKLVECPVVASTPRRSGVRYSGQAYEGGGAMSAARCGRSHNRGAGVYSS